MEADRVGVRFARPDPCEPARAGAVGNFLRYSPPPSRKPEPPAGWAPGPPWNQESRLRAAFPMPAGPRADRIRPHADPMTPCMGFFTRRMRFFTPRTGFFCRRMRFFTPRTGFFCRRMRFFTPRTRFFCRRVRFFTPRTVWNRRRVRFLGRRAGWNRRRAGSSGRRTGLFSRRALVGSGNDQAFRATGPRHGCPMAGQDPPCAEARRSGRKEHPACRRAGLDPP